jgi:aryl-alcohol dehydrogenase-like predicted oxidoreductase
MQYARLGRSGLTVSRLCLGCMGFGTPGSGVHPWALDAEAAKPIFRQAVEAGINFFDTADTYSGGVSEEITGRWVREFLPRDEAVIATKGYFPVGEPGRNGTGLSRKHLMQAVDDSLRRLGVDYIDLYQIHRFDPHTPVEETLEALHAIVQSGKVRYLGASTMHAYQFALMQERARARGWTPFIAMQNLYNLVWREEERQMNRYCLDEGVGLMPWSPLAGGFLAVDWRQTGRQHSARAAAGKGPAEMYGRDEDYRVFDALAAVAAQAGADQAGTALAWLLGRPGVVSPIVGVTKPAHLEVALAAFDISLSPAQVAQLDDAYVWPRLLGFHQ